MNTFNIKESIDHLNLLKKESQVSQKKGLPFMMASVVIWALIIGVRMMDIEIVAKNMLTFVCSCLLMPLAFLFGKIIKVNIFQKMDNPISKLAFLCTLNQMLYLLIVMWAYSQKPEAMLMLYGMVFGAHLLPYGWVYDSKTYTVASIVNTFGSLIVALVWGSIAAAGFVMAVQIIVCIALFAEMRKVTPES